MEVQKGKNDIAASWKEAVEDEKFFPWTWHMDMSQSQGFKVSSQMWKIFSTQSVLGREAACIEGGGRGMKSSGEHAEMKTSKRGLHGVRKP